MVLGAQFIVVPTAVGEATMNVYKGVVMTRVAMNAHIDERMAENYWSSGWAQHANAINR